MKRCSRANLYTNVHSNFTYNYSQCREDCPSTDQLVSGSVSHGTSSEYKSEIKRHQLPICKDVGKSQKYFAKWKKKPNSRGYILHDSIYVTFWKRQKQTQNSEQWLPTARNGRRVLTTQGQEGPRVVGFSMSWLWWWLQNLIPFKSSMNCNT